jgi:hypothetical protein
LKQLTDEQKLKKKESDRRYHEANKEKIKARRQQYYLNNREAIIEKVKDHEEANKESRNQYRADYYLKHKDGKIADRLLANKEIISEKHKQWHIDNADHVTAYRKRYYAENTDLVKSRCKSYYVRNPHVFTAKANKRRAATLKATPAWADLEAIKCVYQEAQYFGYHVDHIIPLQGKNVCGLHVVENLQILPASVNLSKSNKFDEAHLI